MKLKDLISISKTDWISGFKASLGEKDQSKKLQVFESVLHNQPESQLRLGVYGSDADKTRRTYNQTISSLYKELLTYLLIHHRQYPETFVCEVKRSLTTGDEPTFLQTASTVERILTDTENFESLLILNGIMVDYYRLKSVELPSYKKQVEVRKIHLSNLTQLNQLEAYFLDHDLLRRKRSNKMVADEFEQHCSFLEGHFPSKNATRVQVLSRILWLRFIYQFNTRMIVSAQAKQIVEELRKLVKSKPYLSTPFPESTEYALLSFTVHAKHDSMSESEFHQLVETYYGTFDENWIKRLFPNTYWSLITVQVKYYMEASELRFVDDARPVSTLVINGMTRLLDRIVALRKARLKGSDNKKHFGLISESMCRFQLGGENADKACELLEQMLVQEQQTSDARLQHTIYFNLCQFYFLCKKWDQMMDTREKYLRFTKVNGEFDQRSKKVMEFQYLISQIMLREKEMPPKELREHASNLFIGFEPIYDSMVPYTLDHLNLN